MMGEVEGVSSKGVVVLDCVGSSTSNCERLDCGLVLGTLGLAGTVVGLCVGPRVYVVFLAKRPELSLT